MWWSSLIFIFLFSFNFALLHYSDDKRADLSGSTFLGADKELLLGHSPFPTLRDMGNSEQALDSSFFTHGCSQPSPGAVKGDQSRLSDYYYQNGFGERESGRTPPPYGTHGHRGIPAAIALEDSGLSDGAMYRKSGRVIFAQAK